MNIKESRITTAIIDGAKCSDGSHGSRPGSLVPVGLRAAKKLIPGR
jgi:hypothetical protein